MPVFKKAQDIITSGVDMLLPPRCPVTGEIVDSQGMVSPEGWKDIGFIADPFCGRCGVPLSFDTGEDAQCMGCIEQPPIYDKARAALIYDDVSRNLILGFKHGDKTHMVQSFVPWMMQAGKEILGEADALIPVPLHPYRLIARRYNQSALLGDAISKATGIEHLPLALKRTRATPSQGHLKTDERMKNVHKAFEAQIPYKEKLKGKVVVLVDDVYTTGATVNECAKALRKFGIFKIYVLTLARVQKPGAY